MSAMRLDLLVDEESVRCKRLLDSHRSKVNYRDLRSFVRTSIFNHSELIMKYGLRKEIRTIKCSDMDDGDGLSKAQVAELERIYNGAKETLPFIPNVGNNCLCFTCNYHALAYPTIPFNMNFAGVELKNGQRTGRAILGALKEIGAEENAIKVWEIVLTRAGSLWRASRSGNTYDVVLSYAPSSFLRLGHYSPCKAAGSCYRMGGEKEISKWVLAQHATSFVALIYGPGEGVTTDHEGPATGPVLARAWGRMHPSEPVYLLSNTYGLPSSQTHKIIQRAMEQIYPDTPKDSWEKNDNGDPVYHYCEYVYVNEDAQIYYAVDNPWSKLAYEERSVSLAVCPDHEATVECSNCGETISEGDEYSCDDCGTTICYDCGWSDGDGLYCTDCAPTCGYCGEKGRTLDEDEHCLTCAEELRAEQEAAEQEEAERLAEAARLTIQTGANALETVAS